MASITARYLGTLKSSFTRKYNSVKELHESLVTKNTLSDLDYARYKAKKYQDEMLRKISNHMDGIAKSRSNNENQNKNKGSSQQSKD